KVAVDRKRDSGKFLLTGSANVLLLPKLSESLAGRMEILTLWPFSQGGMAGIQERFVDNLFSKDWRQGRPRAIPRSELFERMIAGGYPPVASRPEAMRRKAWFQSYMVTLLQRDVRGLANIADLAAVPQLLSLVASRAGNLLNFADLSRSLS